jgi:hypothetical protein
MNKDYSPYKNQATFVASFFQGKVKELRKKYPSMTVLQLKVAIVDMMVSDVKNAIACQLIRIASDDIDWDYIYNDI